jgi:hypothetical protein
LCVQTKKDLEIKKKNYTLRATHTLSKNNSWPATLLQHKESCHSVKISNSPQQTTNKNTRDNRSLPRDTRREKHDIKKGLPGCYIEIQATIEKKEQVVKEGKTVRLQLSKYREKIT